MSPSRTASPAAGSSTSCAAGSQTLVVQHLAHRVGVGADVADLSVDGERHGLLGDEEGQRAADESEQDHGEQAELERAAHDTSIGSQDPGRRTGAPSVDGPPVTRPRPDGSPARSEAPGR